MTNEKKTEIQEIIIKRALARGELLWKILSEAKIPMDLGQKLDGVPFDDLDDDEKLLVVKVTNVFCKAVAEIDQAFEAAEAAPEPPTPSEDAPEEDKTSPETPMSKEEDETNQIPPAGVGG